MRPWLALRGVPLLVALASGCTQAPDVVAVAFGGPDGGGADLSRQGGADSGDASAVGVSVDAGVGECDYDQALLDARIPFATLVVAISCEVPLGAVQPVSGEPPSQQLLSELLNTSARLDDMPTSPQADRCESEPGRWYVEGEIAYLCPELCQFVNDIVSDLIQASCDAASGQGPGPSAGGASSGGFSGGPAR